MYASKNGDKVPRTGKNTLTGTGIFYWAVFNVFFSSNDDLSLVYHHYGRLFLLSVLTKKLKDTFNRALRVTV